MLVVVASVRDGRIGRTIGDWIIGFAREHGSFNVEVADLKDIDLPLMTEPNHPRLKQYTQDVTKAWSATVAAADAFIFVMPEYNFFVTAPLINALDYLVQEWAYKPVGLVSYGGVSGGLRAAQAIKTLITSFNMMPIKEAVSLPMVTDHINDDGTFEPYESATNSTTAMLDALVQWEKAMHQLRSK